MSAKNFIKKFFKDRDMFIIYCWIVAILIVPILIIFPLSVRVFCSILLAAITPMAIFGLPVCFSAIKESLLEIRNKKNKRSAP
jgi:hypothetical protein